MKVGDCCLIVLKADKKNVIVVELVVLFANVFSIPVGGSCSVVRIYSLDFGLINSVFINVTQSGFMQLL